MTTAEPTSSLPCQRQILNGGYQKEPEEGKGRRNLWENRSEDNLKLQWSGKKDGRKEVREEYRQTKEVGSVGEKGRELRGDVLEK